MGLYEKWTFNCLKVIFYLERMYESYALLSYHGFDLWACVVWKGARKTQPIARWGEGQTGHRNLKFGTFRLA